MVLCHVLDLVKEIEELSSNPTDYGKIKFDAKYKEYITCYNRYMKTHTSDKTVEETLKLIKELRQKL